MRFRRRSGKSSRAGVQLPKPPELPPELEVHLAPSNYSERDMTGQRHPLDADRVSYHDHWIATQTAAGGEGEWEGSDRCASIEKYDFH